MPPLAEVAPAFVEMAHTIVWTAVATADPDGRPRSRVLHPFWRWDGEDLVGWVATGPTPVKRAGLETSPFVSCTYWAPSHDTCTADCEATWHFDEETRRMVWETFAGSPPPLGYDPSMIPGWDGPMSPGFAALRLTPYRIRVMPGSVLLGQGGEVLHWRR